MHKVFFSEILLVTLALSLTACSTGSGITKSTPHTVVIGKIDPNGPVLKASGKWSSTNRVTGDFHAIDVRDCMKVDVTVGGPLRVSVETDDNISSAIDTRVENGKLIISANRSFQASRTPKVVISVPTLTEACLQGSGDLVIIGVSARDFKIETSGSGTFYANGKVINESVNASGSGKVDLVRLTADNVKIDMSGSGACNLDSEKTLDAKLSGSGSIKYLGNPGTLKKGGTGSGSITQLVL
jgi:hypothetical protein